MTSIAKGAGDTRDLEGVEDLALFGRRVENLEYAHSVAYVWGASSYDTVAHAYPTTFDTYHTMHYSTVCSLRSWTEKVSPHIHRRKCKLCRKIIERVRGMPRVP